MAEVKFVTAVKYNGDKYPAHTPFEVEDKDVEALVKDGAIVTVPPKAEEGDKSPLDSMKVDDLKAYAKSKNIDISKVTRRDDIIATIKAAESGESEGSGESEE